jgi:hypothetical protein
LLSLLPAEIYVGLSGNPGAGIVVYGLLFYLAPLAGLIGTFAADRSRDHLIFVYACCSTALLCPLVFGFPTEMWLAHAVFWPALAVSHYANRTVAGTALVFVTVLTLAFTHEGALVLAFVIVATLAPRGLRDASFLRAAAVLVVVLALCKPLPVETFDGQRKYCFARCGEENRSSPVEFAEAAANTGVPPTAEQSRACARLYFTHPRTFHSYGRDRGTPRALNHSGRK